MPPLPIIRTAREAVLTVLREPLYALFACMPWFLGLLAMQILVQIFPVVPPGAEGAPHTYEVGRILSFTLLNWTVGTVAGALTAVAWHRFILLGERVGPGVLFNLDRNFFKYFGRILIMSAAAFAAVALARLLVAPLVPGGGAAAWMVALAFILALSYIAARFSMVLPAAAVGDAQTGFIASWRLTRGNGWPFIAAYVLIALGLVLALAAIALFFGLLRPLTGGILTPLHIALNILVQGIGLLSTIGFLSLAYGLLSNASPAARGPGGPPGHAG